jgi:hypothetical protein
MARKKDGYYDVYLFSHQGENMNELLHTGNELKTEKCCEQQPSVVPASSDVLMATALPSSLMSNTSALYQVESAEYKAHTSSPITGVYGVVLD